MTPRIFLSRLLAAALVFAALTAFVALARAVAAPVPQRPKELTAEMVGGHLAI